MRDVMPLIRHISHITFRISHIVNPISYIHVLLVSKAVLTRSLIGQFQTAIETHVMLAIHKKLFTGLTELYAKEEAALQSTVITCCLVMVSCDQRCHVI